MPKHPIQLSDHFTCSRLIRFVLPCIGTMLFTSIYGIVDGLCVSNFVGKTAFAAINLIMPLPQLLGTIGFMLGTGGSAIVGITLGEGDRKKADRYFSMFMWAALVSAGVLAELGIVFLRPVGRRALRLCGKRPRARYWPKRRNLCRPPRAQPTASCWTTPYATGAS